MGPDCHASHGRGPHIVDAGPRIPASVHHPVPGDLLRGMGGWLRTIAAGYGSWCELWPVPVFSTHILAFDNRARDATRRRTVGRGRPDRWGPWRVPAPDPGPRRESR